MSANSPVRARFTAWLCCGLLIASASVPGSPSDDEATRRFIDRARAGDLAAVRAMSKGRETSLVSTLIADLDLARREEEYPFVLQRLRKSLAALGHSDSRAQIRAELSSANLYTLAGAFEDAAEVGGDDMIVAIAERLYDTSPGGRPIGPDGHVSPDEGVAAPRHLAVVALSRLVTDPTAPRIDLKRIMYREEDVARWQAWWAVHRVHYEGADKAPPHPIESDCSGCPDLGHAECSRFATTGLVHARRLVPSDTAALVEVECRAGVVRVSFRIPEARLLRPKPAFDGDEPPAYPGPGYFAHVELDRDSGRLLRLRGE